MHVLLCSWACAVAFLFTLLILSFTISLLSSNFNYIFAFFLRFHYRLCRLAIPLFHAPKSLKKSLGSRRKGVARRRSKEEATNKQTKASRNQIERLNKHWNKTKTARFESMA